MGQCPKLILSHYGKDLKNRSQEKRVSGGRNTQFKLVQGTDLGLVKRAA